ALTLAGQLGEELPDSGGHAKKARDTIAALGGESITTRDPAPIVHTEDARTMLEEALKTESKAADTYQKIVPLVKAHPVFYHTIFHILKDETNSVIEMEALLGR